MNRYNSVSAHIWALLGIGCVSFSAIFVRLAEVTPTTSAFFRGLYAVPFLALFWFLERRGREDGGRSGRQRLIAIAGGLFLGFDLAFWHRSIHLIGAGLGTVLGNTQVVFVGILAWWLHRERPSRAAFMAVPVVFAGVILISGLGFAGSYGSDPIMGVVFGLLTGVTYACFLLTFRRSGKGSGASWGPLFDVTVGVVAAVFAIGLFDGQLDLSFSWPAHGWLVALALGSQTVGWQLIGIALPRLPALETSVLLLLQPVLTVIWARLIFAEFLSPLQGAGMALVLGGVGWISVRGSLSG